MVYLKITFLISAYSLGVKPYNFSQPHTLSSIYLSLFADLELGLDLTFQIAVSNTKGEIKYLYPAIFHIITEKLFQALKQMKINRRITIN